MDKSSNKLVIVGTGTFAEFIYKHFQEKSNYDVVAFSVEEKFISRKTLLGKPVVPFENISAEYPPSEYSVFVAIGFRDMNRVRAYYVEKALEKGYKLANYISPSAEYFTDETLPGNCFIDDNVVVQPFVKLGKGVILWAGSIISHHTKIGNYVLLGPSVSVAGQCEIKDYAFLGANCVIAHNITIEEGTLVGAGSVITFSTEKWHVYISSKPIVSRRKSYDFF